MYWGKQMLNLVVHTHIRVIVIRFRLKPPNCESEEALLLKIFKGATEE